MWSLFHNSILWRTIIHGKFVWKNTIKKLFFFSERRWSNFWKMIFVLNLLKPKQNCILAHSKSHKHVCHSFLFENSDIMDFMSTWKMKPVQGFRLTATLNALKNLWIDVYVCVICFSVFNLTEKMEKARTKLTHGWGVRVSMYMYGIFGTKPKLIKFQLLIYSNCLFFRSSHSLHLLFQFLPLDIKL